MTPEERAAVNAGIGVGGCVVSAFVGAALLPLMVHALYRIAVWSWGLLA